MKLIERLTLIQTAANMNDEQMGARLRISPTLWIYVKQGKREMGVKPLRGVLRAFPELKQEVLDYLTDEGEARVERETAAVA